MRKGTLGEGFGEGCVRDPTGPEGWRMTGSALKRWTLYWFRVPCGGVWGGVRAIFDQAGGLADDGALDVAWPYSNGEGVWGRGGTRSGSVRRLADDGKRF